MNYAVFLRDVLDLNSEDASRVPRGRVVAHELHSMLREGFRKKLLCPSTEQLQSPIVWRAELYRRATMKREAEGSRLRQDGIHDRPISENRLEIEGSG